MSESDLVRFVRKVAALTTGCEFRGTQRPCCEHTVCLYIREARTLVDQPVSVVPQPAAHEVTRAAAPGQDELAP